VGAVVGSFACCQAWRIYYRAEKKKDPGKFSVCLHCKKQLKWFDKVPIVSWLMLRGKCRYCHKRIGRAEIAAEVGGAAASAVLAMIYLSPLLYGDFSTLAAVLQIALMVVAMIMLAIFIILSVYDSKWGELPTKLLYWAVGLGLAIWILTMLSHLVAGSFRWTEILSMAGAVAILALPCLVLYKMSDETLMGGGDWWLALSLSLLIGNWWLALWAMTFACLFASVFSVPTVIRTNRRTLHFAPYLVAGAFAVLSCQFIILDIL